MRKYFTLFLLCLLPLALLAQSGVSTSLFTGRMSYTIPIYSIDDPDFNLDIADFGILPRTSDFRRSRFK